MGCCLKLDDDGFSFRAPEHEGFVADVWTGIGWIERQEGINYLARESDFAKANPIVVGSAYNGRYWDAVLEDESAAWAEYTTGWYTRSQFTAAVN